jgi:hypothetical protein
MVGVDLAGLALDPDRRRGRGPHRRAAPRRARHRRIALIGGDTDDPMRVTPPHHRRVGYLDALREAGIEYDPDLEILGYFTVEGGEAATQIPLDRCACRRTSPSSGSTTTPARGCSTCQRCASP